MSGCYKRPVGSISPPTCVHVCARARVCGCFWILGVDGRAVYEFLLQKQRGARSSSRQWHSLPSSMAATCFVKKKVKSAMVDPCPDCAVCRASTASATSSSRTPTTASLRTGSPTACLALPMPDPLPLLIPPPPLLVPSAMPAVVAPPSSTPCRTSRKRAQCGPGHSGPRLRCFFPAFQ